MTREATVLIVPGLRDHVPQHWQTLLASRLPRVRTVTPMGRDDLDCLARVEAIEEAAASIDGPIILVAHSGGVIALAHWAGATLAAAVLPQLDRRGAADRPQQIVALPLSAPRQRERGFNQAGEIAARVAAATGLPVATPLARRPGGVPQAVLPWAERRGNVHGAFVVRHAVRGARFALVDDVMTTGATLAEASHALVRAGAARVECWVVARTLRPESA